MQVKLAFAFLLSSFSSLLSETPSFSDSAQAQWLRHYASGLVPAQDAASAVAVDAAGNIYVSGNSRGAGTSDDFVTIKYDASGARQWVARYNGPGNAEDRVAELAVDAAGNVYVTGYSSGSSSFDDYATVKYNAAGVQQWVALYHGPGNSFDRLTALAVDTQGNVYVTGYSWDLGISDDCVTVKYNASGAQQWVARYDGPANAADRANEIAVDAVGNVYVSGYSRDSDTFDDYVTIKYDAAGIQQWVARYNGPRSLDDRARTLAVDAAGNIYVSGFSRGSGTLDDYATIKYDAAGVQQWVARYNGPQNNADLVTAMALDDVGNVYVSGYSRGAGTVDDYATIKYNAAGVQQWVARYNGPVNSFDRTSALAVDAGANVYVTGFSRGSGASNDYATVKYDASGIEQWVARYNEPGNANDYATALAVDAAGNVYVTGNSLDSVTSNDYVTVKYDASGSERWVARYNGLDNSFDHATALAVDAAGNVYVTGFSRGANFFDDYATVKYNASGNEQWVARYDGPEKSFDRAAALAVDAAGHVYVTGYSADSVTFNDYATIKYDADGVQQWAARYDGPGNNADLATALAVDAAGNVYVTGYSAGSDSSADYATIKYNASGVQQWVARYGGPGKSADRAAAIAADAAGNIYVTGYSAGSTTFDDYATVKYGAAGVQQWVARYNGPGNSDDRAAALAVDAAGNVYVTGHSPGSNSEDDYTTIKYDAAGVQQWMARYNGPGNSTDQSVALAVDADGNVYVTGNSLGSNWEDDYATIKYDASGVEQWVSRYNGLGNGTDRATALAVDAAANVYVTGFSRGLGASDDYVTVKYNASGIEQWVMRYNGPGNADDHAAAVAVDAAGNVYVAGSSQGTDNSVYSTIKYLQAKTAVATTPAFLAQYKLAQNFPNPFNPTTAIRYGLPKTDRVTLKIYSLLGEEIATLVNDAPKAAGYHVAIWDGRDMAGRNVAGGVYVYRMQAGNFISIKKLTLVK